MFLGILLTDRPDPRLVRVLRLALPTVLAVALTAGAGAASGKPAGPSPDARLANAAIVFNGSDAYVTVPDSPSLDTTGPLTITAWIYLDGYQEWTSILTKGGFPNQGEDDGIPNNYALNQGGPKGGSDFGHLRWTNDAPTLKFRPFVESDTVIALREWHFVALTYDNATIRFYFDGRPDGGGTQAGPLNPNNHPLTIGADFPGADEFWNGRMDEIAVWTRTLSEGEIRSAMNGGAKSLAQNLAAYWKFDEGSGATVADQSGNGNNGRLVGGAAWTASGAPLPTPAPVTGKLRSASITRLGSSRLRARWIFDVVAQGPLTAYWQRNGRQISRSSRSPAKVVDSFVNVVGGKVPKGTWTAFLRVRGANGRLVLVPGSRVRKVVR